MPHEFIQTELNCRGKTIPIGTRTLIMGILNVTPDSFSDGGSYLSTEMAIERAKLMVAEGADIIDIGGESTRPGAEIVTVEEELKRVIPLIEALQAAIDVPISIDTYKADVARRALDAGAHLINDVWGLRKEPEKAVLAAEYGCPIILMHNRKDASYRHFLTDVIKDMKQSIDLAQKSGIRQEQIVLDPGIGFAKSYEQNIFLMKHLKEIVELGYPVVLGTSRKSMIQNTLQLPANDIVEGTAATVALGIMQGCQIMRVHDIKEMKRVAVMTDTILRSEL
jgi:dihydropteroate synthase